jgi:hypothetical protein
MPREWGYIQIVTHIYTIRVRGWLDPQWGAWFEPMRITHESCTPPATTLTGRVRDQAALRAILNQLWDLNLTIEQVQRFDDTEADHV